MDKKLMMAWLQAQKKQTTELDWYNRNLNNNIISENIEEPYKDSGKKATGTIARTSPTMGEDGSETSTEKEETPESSESPTMSEDGNMRKRTIQSQPLQSINPRKI